MFALTFNGRRTTPRFAARPYPTNARSRGAMETGRQITPEIGDSSPISDLTFTGGHFN